MLPHLQIAYITGRKDPKFDWFADSLDTQLREEAAEGGRQSEVQLLVIDFWADDNGKQDGGPERFDRGAYFASRAPSDILTTVVPPKPCVWQGAQRKTKRNYFCAANARNTAICYAPDGWIAYVDDLSVLMPGWLKTVRRAQRERFAALGAYKKVTGIKVEEGVVTDGPANITGLDSRWVEGRTEPVTAPGGHFYGASLALPIDWLLHVNGWDERADARGMGSEDYLTGIMLARAGFPLRYCQSMLTYELDEPDIEQHFTREIPRLAGREDMSLVLLHHVQHPESRFAPQTFNLRELRARVLRGEPFPPALIPEHCWYTGTPLSQL